MSDAVLFVTDIAIKLGKRDVSELSPTDIAIEVLHNFCLMPFLLISSALGELKSSWELKLNLTFVSLMLSNVPPLYLAGARTNWQLFEGGRGPLCRMLVQALVTSFFLIVHIFFYAIAIKVMLSTSLLVKKKKRW